jgi:hypothetical protein
MISRKVLDRVRNGVCAVGYLTVPLTEYMKDTSRPYHHVLGTGFLVRPTTAITNRHVIEALIHAQADLGFPPSQFFLSIVVPGQGKPLQNTLRMIRHFAAMPEPGPDIGFLEFKIVFPEHFKSISPLSIAKAATFGVSDEVAVCGYPYGTSMLKRGHKIYRFGPVVQQGSISAISPFDTSTAPDEILLDVRTAGGMSGAPVFRPSNGEVIAIHYAGWEATTALALPLTSASVSSWLRDYDKLLADSPPLQGAA